MSFWYASGMTRHVWPSLDLGDVALLDRTGRPPGRDRSAISHRLAEMPEENADGLTMLPFSAFLVRMVPVIGAHDLGVVQPPLRLVQTGLGLLHLALGRLDARVVCRLSLIMRSDASSC